MLIKLVIIVIGYVLGRWTHVYLNVWTGNVGWFPHHWIIGGLMMIIGYFLKNKWGKWLFWLGFGFFISDFNDFWAGKTFETDEIGGEGFWWFD